jgi:hypothetical protein
MSDANRKIWLQFIDIFVTTRTRFNSYSNLRDFQLLQRFTVICILLDIANETYVQYYVRTNNVYLITLEKVSETVVHDLRDFLCMDKF